MMQTKHAEGEHSMAVPESDALFEGEHRKDSRGTSGSTVDMVREWEGSDEAEEFKKSKGVS